MAETIEKVRTFLGEVRAEWRKINFLSRKEVMASTIVVLIAVFLVAVFLGTVDIILSRIISVLITR